jgi:hypothetical protein
MSCCTLTQLFSLSHRCSSSIPYCCSGIYKNTVKSRYLKLYGSQTQWISKPMGPRKNFWDIWGIKISRINTQTLSGLDHKITSTFPWCLRYWCSRYQNSATKIYTLEFLFYFLRTYIHTQCPYFLHSVQTNINNADSI